MRHFKDCGSDLVPVPNTNLIVGQPFNSKVLSKLSVLEILPAQFALPIPVGFNLINHHGTLFPAVAFEIALAIPVQIEPSSKHAP